MNRLVIRILPVFWTVLFSLPSATAWPAPKQSESIGAKVLHQQKKIRRVQKAMKQHKTKIAEYSKKKLTLLADLEDIDARLNLEREKLQKLKQEALRQKDLIGQKKQEIDHVRSKKDAVKDHVTNRLAAYYRMSNMGAMSITFSPETLPELLSFKEYFQYLLNYDRTVISSYRGKIGELSEARENLQNGTERLVAMIEQAKDLEKSLLETRISRLALLNRVNTEKKLYRQALKEMEEAAVNLSVTLERLKKKKAAAIAKKRRRLELAKKARPVPRPGFDRQKGRLDPPVEGLVVTYFGHKDRGKFGIATHENGIDIKTKPGTKIKAIYRGKVVYSGFLRGYGNLIIIDHGQQYYSLISRAANFFKEVDQSVAKGEVIGIMSDQGGLLGEGLHFEIRHGTKPENPLHWINNAKLQIKSTK